MSAEDKALEETSTHLVDAVLEDSADKTDEVEDEFVKSLISAQQRQKTPSPPPVNKENEPVGIIETDPFSDQPFNESEHVEEEKQPTPEPVHFEPEPVKEPDPVHVESKEQKPAEEPEPEPPVWEAYDTKSIPVSELAQLPQVISQLDELDLKSDAAEQHTAPAEETHFEQSEQKHESLVEETIPDPVDSKPSETEIKHDEPAEEPIVHNELPAEEPIVIPEVHNKEHVIEPDQLVEEPAPITSTTIEESPKPVIAPEEVQSEPLREPSPVFQSEERIEPAIKPVEDTYVPTEKPEEKKEEHVPEVPKSSEPEIATIEPTASINAPPASNDDSSSTSRKANQQNGLFKRVRSHCAII